MKPLIFEYLELFENSDIDKCEDLIEYDENLNLSVTKETRSPAIEYLNLSTRTNTKSIGEGTDSDKNTIGELMGTKTKTFSDHEPSDSDQSLFRIKTLMNTKTLTESKESGSDNDR